MSPIRLILALVAVLALPIQPQENPRDPEYSVTVTTRSGMTVLGAASFGKIKITSDLGEHILDPAKIRTVDFHGQTHQVMLGTSMLTGRIEMGDFTIRTEFGTFRISGEKLRGIYFQGTSKAVADSPAAVKEPRKEADPSNRLLPAVSATLEIEPRELFLVPDESAVLLLDSARQRLLRYDSETLKLDPQVLEVWKGFRGLRASADGRTVFGFGSVEGTVAGGRLVAYENQVRKQSWQVPLDFEPVDVAPSPRGRIFILGRNPEPVIAVLDPLARKVVSRWGGMPSGSRILPGADGRRLYIASDDGTSGTLATAWLSGPGYGDALKARPSPVQGRFHVGSPTLLVGRGRFLASGSAVFRIADLPEDDLKFVGRIDPCDCISDAGSQELVIVSTTGAALKILSVPDFSVRKAYAPGARLGEMRLDRKGRLFALTAPEFKPGSGPRPALHQFVRYDLADDLAALASALATSRPREVEPAGPGAILEIPLKDRTGGRAVEPAIEIPAWKPDVKTAQSCPACEGKGRVKVDKPGEGGVTLRHHQVCLRCAGSGKLDLITCDACRGRRRIHVVGRADTDEGRRWIVGEVGCGCCNGAGWTGKPLVLAPAEAGKPVACPACGGAAQVRVQRIKDGYGTEEKADCLRCGGIGKVVRATCLQCRGTGYVDRRISFTIEGCAGEQDGRLSCPECDSSGVTLQAP